jgi:hypothetical protein
MAYSWGFRPFPRKLSSLLREVFPDAGLDDRERKREQLMTRFLAASARVGTEMQDILGDDDGKSQIFISVSLSHNIFMSTWVSRASAKLPLPCSSLQRIYYGFRSSNLTSCCNANYQ